jgi:hypothetical protein
MIAYDLKCANGHTFEGWFEDSQAYEEQSLKGLIACPRCDETRVVKVLSTFGIKSARPARKADPLPVDMARLGQKVVDYVEKHFDNVGCDFAKEALKIHYGASEPRNIRGYSTKEEEKVLSKEGIQFFKLPLPSPPDTDAWWRRAIDFPQNLCLTCERPRG